MAPHATGRTVNTRSQTRKMLEEQHIDRPTDDVLKIIFSLVPWEDRVFLFKVCTRWRKLMSGERVWQTVDIEPDEDIDGLCIWFNRHAAAIQDVTLRVSGGADFVYAPLYRLLPAVEHLRALRLSLKNAEEDLPLEIELLAGLPLWSQLTQLTQLSISNISAPLEMDELNEMLADLPALQDATLHFQVDEVPEDEEGTNIWIEAELLTEFPCALLRSTRLVQLNIGVFHYDLDAALATSLTNLPDGITALSNLRRLTLHDGVPISMPPVITCLTALTSFSLTQQFHLTGFIGCEELEGLPPSVQELTLHNAPLHLLSGVTALERLVLHVMRPHSDIVLTDLTRLSSLELGHIQVRDNGPLAAPTLRSVQGMDLVPFKAAFGLRHLRLQTLQAGSVKPWPLTQLTRLQLHGSSGPCSAEDVQALLSEMPLLEVLDAYAGAEEERLAPGATQVMRLHGFDFNLHHRGLVWTREHKVFPATHKVSAADV